MRRTSAVDVRKPSELTSSWADGRAAPGFVAHGQRCDGIHTSIRLSTTETAGQAKADEDEDRGHRARLLSNTNPNTHG